jgi:hypothetical protein
VQAGELAVFEPSQEAISFHAETDTEFVLGSAARYPYELALGNYSVHTSTASLEAGEWQIAEIKLRLQKESLMSSNAAMAKRAAKNSLLTLQVAATSITSQRRPTMLAMRMRTGSLVRNGGVGSFASLRAKRGS